jgi:hypothetical protein
LRICCGGGARELAFTNGLNFSYAMLRVKQMAPLLYFDGAPLLFD